MRRPELHRYTEPLTLLLLAGVCYAFFFHGITTIGFVGPDEPRYAAVAREMYLSGDYITPRLNGTPWFEKPVLMYWGAAISYAIFGVGEFGARLPSSLGATLIVFFVYFTCRKLWGRPSAIAASLILASSVGFFAFARAASMDMPLTVCLTGALLSFLMGYNANGPDRRWWFFAFYCFLGLGVLAKGPVALVLPGASLLGYLFFRGRLDEWREWHPKYAWMILAVAGPWYLAVTWANGYEFIRVFFINQNFERFTSTVHGHSRPFYFYIPGFLMLTFPWTYLILPTLRRTFDRTDRLLLWWTIIPILFFSFAGSKLPGYILPSIPAAIMLFSREIPKGYSRPFKIAVFIEAGTMLFIGVAFGFFGQMLGVDPHVNGLVITGVTVVLAIMLTVIAFWMKPPVFAVFNLMIMTIAVLIATTFVLPSFEKSDTMRPWESVLKRTAQEGQTVFMYRPSRWMEYGLGFYSANKLQGVYTLEELDAVIGPTKLLFVTDDRGLIDLGQAGIETEVVETVGNQTALWAWRGR